MHTTFIPLRKSTIDIRSIYRDLHRRLYRPREAVNNRNIYIQYIPLHKSKSDTRNIYRDLHRRLYSPREAARRFHLRAETLVRRSNHNRITGRDEGVSVLTGRAGLGTQHTCGGHCTRKNHKVWVVSQKNIWGYVNNVRWVARQCEDIAVRAKVMRVCTPI